MWLDFKYVLAFNINGSLSCLGNLLYKTLNFFSQKFFWIFNFGHLFLSIFENPRKVLEKNKVCDHNCFLSCGDQKKVFQFVSIIFQLFFAVRI
jgi:hypothetical protein